MERAGTTMVVPSLLLLELQPVGTLLLASKFWKTEGPEGVLVMVGVEVGLPGVKVLVTVKVFVGDPGVDVGVRVGVKVTVGVTVLVGGNVGAARLRQLLPMVRIDSKDIRKANPIQRFIFGLQMEWAFKMITEL